jgi:branched-chain amino acid transport system permease protein
MTLLLQQIVSGLAMGAIYASLALALVMIFNATNHINFAQGEMALLSTYVAWTLVNVGLPYPVAFVLTVVLSFAFGVVVEQTIVRRFHKSQPLTLVVVFVGLFLAFNATAGWIWGFYLLEFPSPVQSLSTGTSLIGAHELFVVGVIGVLLALLFVFFRFTTFGLAMRGAAFNPASARLCGIRVGRMLALAWGLAGAIGAIAGMLIAPVVFLDPNMMLGLLLYAFASAMLGGLSNPAGAVAGGLIFGVLENLVGTYLIGHGLKLTFALVVVVAVLVIRPSGLFARSTVKRV